MRPLAAVVAALPVGAFVALDPAGWYPFGPAKWMAVSVIGCVAVAVLASRAAIRVPIAAATAWAVLLVLLVAAAAVAVDPRLAWIGTAERHLGVAGWLLFAGCFLVGVQLTDAGSVGLVAHGTVVATLLAGAYATIEAVAGRPVDLDVVTSRLGGPFGSAAYLGAAMCLAVPVCGGVALDGAVPRAWRAVAALAMAGGVVALLGSGTRGAWIGIAAAGALAAPTAARRAGRPRRALLGAAALVLCALAVTAPLLDDVVDRSRPPTARLAEWGVALDVVAGRPLLGAGPEGYRIAVAEGIDAAYEREYGRTVAPDRAHSGPLDVAVTAGVPAAVAYAVLLSLAAAAAISVAGRQRPLVGGIAVAVVAYAAQQLVLFPIAELDPVFWLFAGIAVGTASARAVTVRVPRPAGIPVLAGVAGLVTLAAFVTGLAGVAADRLDRRAARSPDVAAAIADAERAVQLRPDAIRSRLLLAEIHSGRGTLAGVEAAIETVHDARRWSPDDPIVRAREAAHLSQRAEITGEAAHVAAALRAWRDLVSDDPHCARCRIGLGFAASLGGDAELAHASWTAAAALSDDPLPRELLAALADATGIGTG